MDAPRAACVEGHDPRRLAYLASLLLASEQGKHFRWDTKHGLQCEEDCGCKVLCSMIHDLDIARHTADPTSEVYKAQERLMAYLRTRLLGFEESGNCGHTPQSVLHAAGNGAMSFLRDNLDSAGLHGMLDTDVTVSYPDLVDPYYAVVPFPISMGEITQLLANDCYVTLHDLRADFELMLKSALDFNGKTRDADEVSRDLCETIDSLRGDVMAHLKVPVNCPALVEICRSNANEIGRRASKRVIREMQRSNDSDDEGDEDYYEDEEIESRAGKRVKGEIRRSSGSDEGDEEYHEEKEKDGAELFDWYAMERNQLVLCDLACRRVARDLACHRAAAKASRRR